MIKMKKTTESIKNHQNVNNSPKAKKKTEEIR